MNNNEIIEKEVGEHIFAVNDAICNEKTTTGSRP